MLYLCIHNSVCLSSEVRVPNKGVPHHPIPKCIYNLLETESYTSFMKWYSLHDTAWMYGLDRANAGIATSSQKA